SQGHSCVRSCRAPFRPHHPPTGGAAALTCHLTDIPLHSLTGRAGQVVVRCAHSCWAFSNSATARGPLRRRKADAARSNALSGTGVGLLLTHELGRRWPGNCATAGKASHPAITRPK